mgnify:CR=1 FL=1
MERGEEKFTYKDFECEAEYQYDEKSYHPVKISVRVPTSNGFKCHPVVFSDVSLESKDQCINFLVHETQKFIDNDFEVKK